jgi:imidazolonepropionase-like amidohydrolase
VIDAKGMFLMPGMTEGHAHLSFETVTATEDLITPPPEEHTLLTARVAKSLLDAGFTSAWGASEAKLRLGVAVRNEVDAGRLPGPRIRAGSLEITVTGGMGDESKNHNPRTGPAIVVDGVEEMRKAVRMCCREGCDNIKLDVSGDPFYPNTPAYATPMSFEEIHMAVETAHSFGRKVNAHTRSIGGTQACLRAGVDVLYHCEYSDEKTLDMMEEAKDRIFVAPTVGLFHTLLHEASPWVTPEIARAMGVDKLLEESQKTHTELRKRGIRHVIGGDYGFAWSKNGTNARDVGFFVQYFGYTPAEALRCATRNGGLLMGSAMNDKLGEVKEGYLADLVLVDGDPLSDVSLLVKPERLVMIMKGGELYKNTSGVAQRRVAA